MDRFTKITAGYVSQLFEKNKDGKFVCVQQEFIAADECVYENYMGEVIDEVPDHDHHNIEMLQPDKIAIKRVHLSGTDG
jgi:hypothetical protein